MHSVRPRLFCAALLLATGYWLLATDLTAQQATFRTGVTLVTTDVIARGERGQFVADLTRENFSVLEDGQPQRIESFVMVQGGRTYNLLTPSSPSAAQEGLVLPQARPKAADANGRVFLILIDDLHFEPELTPHVRQLIKTIVDTLLHEGDLIGVVSTGPSFIELGLTYDKKLVAETANKIRGSGYLPSEIFKMIENSQGPGDSRNNAQMAFYTAYNMLSDPSG